MSLDVDRNRLSRFADPFPSPQTAASGIRVPSAIGDFMILDALRESGGHARAVTDQRLLSWAQRAAELEGISVCPEAGAAIAALEDMVADGSVDREERVVIFNTGAAQKYLEVLPTELPHVRAPVDWAAISEERPRV